MALLHSFMSSSLLHGFLWPTPSLLLFTTVFSFLASLIYVYVSFPTWRVKHVPGPPHRWGIGHLPLLEKYQSSVFIKLAREYGSIYRFHVGRQPLVMVADPELFRQLTTKNFKSVPNRSTPPYVASVDVLNKGLFFSRDMRWHSMRNLLLPLYHSEQMHKYVPLINSDVCVLGDKLNDKAEGEEVDMLEYFIRMSLDVIGEAAFGTKFGLLEGDGSAHGPDSEMLEYVDKSVAPLRMDGSAPLSTVLGVLFPILQGPARSILSKIPGTADWDQETSINKLQEKLNEIVERREKEKDGKERRVDALTILLSAKENSKASRALLTSDYVSALTLELLLAGSETAATTLAFLVHLVSGHPEVEEKLLKEIDDFGPPDRRPTAEDLADGFPYLDQVLKETMRFFPTSPVIAREVSEDIQLGGYHLPKGTWVWMVLNAVTRDPRHFKDPDEFRPERFDPECEEEKERHPYALMPFGAGPRSCIGRKFAMLEMKMTVVHVYQRFTFTRMRKESDEALPLQFGVIVRPKYGVKLRVHHRRAPSSSP